VRHLPYQEWVQCGTVEKKTLYISSFWRDALDTSADRTDAEGQPSQQLPLVDILEMVADAQSGRAKDVAVEEEEEEEPSFYTNEGLLDGDSEDAPKDFNFDAEQAGTKSVEEILKAHAQAEADILRQRQALGSRSARRPSHERELKEALPRRKRRMVRHSGVDALSRERSLLEEDTASESEDEEAPRRPERRRF